MNIVNKNSHTIDIVYKYRSEPIRATLRLATERRSEEFGETTSWCTAVERKNHAPLSVIVASI